MNAKLWFALLLVPALLAFVPSISESGLPAKDIAAIRSTGEAWMKAANARDFEPMVSIYTEDAMLLPTNAEVVSGRPAIKAFFDGFPHFSDFVGKMVEIEGRKDLAYVRGTYSMKLTLPGVSEPVEDRGKYIEIWRQQADGSWGISHDIFNSDIPAPE
jgi:uncharacterized protein (TIGR02246 family)